MADVRNKGKPQRARSTSGSGTVVSLEEAAAGIFESITDCYYALDPVGRFVEMNERAAQYFATPREQLVGRLAQDVFPKASGSFTETAFRKALDTQTPLHFELPSILSPDRYVEIHAYPSPDRLDVYFRDISDRKRSQDVVRATKQALEDLLEASPLAVSVVDTHGVVRLWNTTAEIVFGWSRDVVLGRVDPTVPPDEQSRFLACLQQTLHDQPVRGLESMRLRQNSELIHVALWSAVLHSEHAAPRVIIFAADISKRKRAEEALRESEERLRMATLATNDAIWDCDLLRNRIWINETHKRLFGERPADVANAWEWWTQRIHPDDRERLMAAMKAALVGGRDVWVEEYRLRRVDGGYAHVLDRAYITRDPSGAATRVLGAIADLTVRKQMEETLRDSEERFRTLADNVAQLAWMADETGWIFWFNQRWFEYTGTRFSDMKGSGWQKVHHPDHLHRVAEKFRFHMEVGRVWEDTFPLRSTNGTYRWFLSRAVPIRDEDGRVLRWFGTHTDITEQRETEEALRQSEEHFRLLADAMPQLVWTSDPAGIVDYYSRRVHEYEGIEKRPDGSWSWAPVVHHEDAQATEQAWAEAVRQGHDYRVEHRIHKTDGAYVWHLSRAVPVRDAQGNILKWFGTATDIDALKRAEQSLRESEERLSLSLRASGSGVWDWNLLTEDMWWSPETAELWGVKDPEQLRTQKGRLNAIVKEDRQRVVENLRRVWETRVEWNEEFRINHWSKGPRWLGALGRTYYDDNGQPARMIGIILDITERKRAEEQLAQLNETLEQRVEERTTEVKQLADQLRALAAELTRVEQRERKRLARVLHDHIQQLLVAAQMQLEWLRRNPPDEQTKSTVQGVVSILKEAISASRSLTVELSPPILHEAGLIGGLTWLAARMEDKNQFKVHVRADNHAEPADEETRFLLFESIRELLFNAVKHSGVSEAYVTMTLAKGNFTKLAIEDRGAGFDAAAIRRHGAGGGSFGLFSIQQRLTHIGGNMDLETTPGQGVRVTLLAPIRRDQAEIIVAPDAPPVERAGAAMHLRQTNARISILLVDDHKILREGLAGLLQFEHDMEIIGEAADGETALELAERLQPDVVIMDVNMPGLGGIEATRILTEKMPQVKVIGLSMHIEKDTAAIMRASGAVAYLTKGGPSEDLVAAIRACQLR